jgi:hypothetical protein
LSAWFPGRPIFNGLRALGRVQHAFAQPKGGKRYGLHRISTATENSKTGSR